MEDERGKDSRLRKMRGAADSSSASLSAVSFVTFTPSVLSFPGTDEQQAGIVRDDGDDWQ